MDTNTNDLKRQAFLKNLKDSTANLHAQLEGQAYTAALMSTAVNVTNYVTYLEMIKAIHTTYEQDILPVLTSTLNHKQPFSNALLIQQDLASFNHSFQLETNPFTVPAHLRSIPFCLGFMYVMEGSKLGGLVIVKHLKKVLELTGNSTNFLRSSGIETVKLWKDFLTAFSTTVVTNEWEATTIQGAKYAFESIYKYFETNKARNED